MNKNKVYFFLILLFTSCGYWPLVDYYIPKDFKSFNYTLSGSKDTIVELKLEDFNLRIEGKAWLPFKKRSKKLNLFWATIQVDIMNITKDSIYFNLESSKVILKYDGYNKEGILSDITANMNQKEESVNNKLTRKLYVEFKIEDKNLKYLDNHQIILNLVISETEVPQIILEKM
jgi:hypothetical protein